MLTCTFENSGTGLLRHVVVDVLILKGKQILLAKRVGKLLEGGKWALIGGFVGRDETIEDAAKREVLEESGYQISDLRLLRIVDNPNRPNEDRQNIAFVYFAKAGKKVGEADWESDEIKWFDLDKLPIKEEIAFDHFDDIQFYLESLKK